MRARGAIPLLVVVLATLGAPAVAGADIQVTTTVDDNDGSCVDGDCSLRDAISEADGTGEIVRVPPGTFQLQPQLGNLSIFSGVTVQGSGAAATTIRGTAGSSVLSLVDGPNSISGVTITGGTASNGGGIFVGSDGTASLTLNDSVVTGNVASSANGASGGGVFVQSPSTLRLNRSSVVGNRADTAGGGIFSQSIQLVEIVDSTISNNLVSGPAGGGAGGGVAGFATVETASNIRLINTTLSGNQVAGIRPTGASLATFGTLELVHVTVAGSAGAAGNLYVSALAGTPPRTLTIRSTIVVSDTGPACVIVNRAITGAHNLDDDGTCGFSKLGDKPGVANPLLGPLQNNGGSTQTRALLAGSPAINAGDPVSCRPTDQRGVARPQQGACDIGAFEYVPPPPQPGPPPPPPPPPPQDDELPPPVIRKSVNAEVKSGTIRIKLPGRKGYRRLRVGEQIPLGTTIDARKGHVFLVAANNMQGGLATGEFWAGIFKIRQTKGRRPITRLTLTEKLSCKTSGKASSAQKKKKKKRKRRLWGDGRGRFRTEGEFSSATVRGTKWLVEDRCTSTLTRVVRGRVAVRDFVKKKTVIVRRGKKYTARKR